MNKEILCKNLEKRGFTPHVFPDRKAAADYLAENIHGVTVGIGGSVTVQELDVYDRLSENNTVPLELAESPARYPEKGCGGGGVSHQRQRRERERGTG